eukprot:3339861-Prymnesium_polylepis.1
MSRSSSRAWGGEAHPKRANAASCEYELVCVIDVHFRPAGPALCCVASGTSHAYNHTFTVNMLRETD